MDIFLSGRVFARRNTLMIKKKIETEERRALVKLKKERDYVTGTI